MAGRPGVRSGPATRGFPPGSAQALVALVLGGVLGVAGLQRGETAWALLSLGVAALAALSLLRLWTVQRRRARARVRSNR